MGILIRDFISFKNKLHLDNIEGKLEDVRNNGGWFLKLMFHNKGIDMIDLHMYLVSSIIKKSLEQCHLLYNTLNHL